MRRQIVCLVALLALAVAAVSASQAAESMDWEPWRQLPVLDGGRFKPLDTLGWETLRILANRAGLVDPQTGQKLDPTAAYLALIFDWQGWDQKASPHGMGMMSTGSPYFGSREPDKWDQAPLLRLDYLALRTALGLGESQKHVSPIELSKAQIQDPYTGSNSPFLDWAQKLFRSNEKSLTEFETKGLELADKFWSYQSHRMGKRLQVLPIQGSEEGEWVLHAHLLGTDFDEATDPTGNVRKVQQAFRDARKAYLAGNSDRFNRASASFIATVRTFAPQLGFYPAPDKIQLEVAYNHWVPFRFAWIFTLIALLAALVGMGSRWKPSITSAWAFYVAGVVGTLIGFAMRTSITGRAPVTNMYESVLYVGLGIAVLGIIFELIYRKQFILVAAAAVSTVALMLADNSPTLLDPSLKPLQPVLRSNFWLVTHVMTITLSYAAFALALGIANITLGYFLAGSKNRDAIAGLSRFTYKSLQVGVLLLAIGTILGGVWADYAWGRFWGWDPKEVWALIALLGYLALLHARYVGWVRHFGLAACSVACFSLVVVAWYGVNFVLGAGLHSYGFGGGGQTYVAVALLLQFLYVGLAAVRHARTRSAPPPAQPAAGIIARPHTTRSSTSVAERVAP